MANEDMNNEEFVEEDFADDTIPEDDGMVEDETGTEEVAMGTPLSLTTDDVPELEDMNEGETISFTILSKDGKNVELEVVVDSGQFNEKDVTTDEITQELI